MDTLNAAVFLYLEDLIEEDLFLMLVNECEETAPVFPYWKYDRFSAFTLESMTEDECLSEFRVAKKEIPRLLRVLQIPDEIVCENGTKASSLEGLCILLKRFAYPCRYSDLIPRFGRSKPELCLICKEVMRFTAATHGHLLSSFEQGWLRPNKLQEYADAVYEKSNALGNCWGFVDGTVRAICRPEKNQRTVYNGHKRVHALKYQSVVAANGLIANLYGPVEGKSHDAGILRRSNLLNNLETYCNTEEGEPLCIYGDSAYPQRMHMQTPYKHINLTDDQQAFNEAMSKVRVSVEWIFGEIAGYFAFIDFKKNQKIGLQQVGTMYITCALLRNAISCLYGSNTSIYFNLKPPSLEEYFQFEEE